MTAKWQPIAQADKKFQWWARDNYGSESWTWHDGDAWVRKCWREGEDQEEYMCDEWWEPVEYLPETKRN